MSTQIIPGKFKVVQEVSTKLVPIQAPKLKADMGSIHLLDTNVSEVVISDSYVTGKEESTSIRTFRTPKLLNGLRAAVQAFKKMYQAQEIYEAEKRKENRQILAEYGVELANYRAAQTTDPIYSRREADATASEVQGKGLEGFFK